MSKMNPPKSAIASEQTESGFQKALPRPLGNLRRGEVFIASRTNPNGKTMAPELLCLVAENQPGIVVHAHVINGNWGIDFQPSGASMPKQIVGGASGVTFEAGQFEVCSTAPLSPDVLSRLQARMPPTPDSTAAIGQAMAEATKRMRQEFEINPPAPEVKPVRLGSISYVSSVPIIFPTSINREGAGLEHYEDRGDPTPYHRREDIAAALRNRIESTDGQNLAQYSVVGAVTKISLSLQDPHTLDIEFRCNRELSVLELETLHADFSGQLSDGWGEGFEQNALLGATDEIEGDDCALEFSAGFDSEKLTPLVEMGVVAKNLGEPIAAARPRMR